MNRYFDCFYGCLTVDNVTWGMVSSEMQILMLKSQQQWHFAKWALSSVVGRIFPSDGTDEWVFSFIPTALDSNWTYCQEKGTAWKLASAARRSFQLLRGNCSVPEGQADCALRKVRQGDVNKYHDVSWMFHECSIGWRSWSPLCEFMNTFECRACENKMQVGGRDMDECLIRAFAEQLLARCREKYGVKNFTAFADNACGSGD